MKHPPRVIPTLQISDGWLVKTRKFEKPQYLGDPINAVKIFNEKQVDEIVICDIDATREGRAPDLALIESIASEAFMPVAYGGGVRDAATAQRLVTLGIEKVIIGTAGELDPLLLRRMTDVIGSQSVVASIDVRRDRDGSAWTYVSSGRRRTGRTPVDAAVTFAEAGAGELIVTSIDREGSRTGYDLDLIRSVSLAVDIPVVALGGADGVDDFVAAIAAGASAVAAGSRFVFFGRLQGVLITYLTAAELETAWSASPTR